MSTYANQCASHANTALSAFVNENGVNDNDEESISALLASLQHLCDAQGFSFADLLDWGRQLYDEDIKKRGKASPETWQQEE